MPIVIAGFSSTDKVPGAYGEVKFGTGAISAASIPLVLLLVGLKTSAGSANADTEVKSIFSQDDATSYFGAGSQLERMCRKAIKYQGVQIKAIAVAEAGGSIAATASITISGSWIATGTWTYRVAGETFTGTVGTTDTATQVAAAIRDAFNANAGSPVTAASAAGVVTLTTKNKGTSQNRHVLFQDRSLLPAGASSAIAGGAAVTGDGVLFAGGTGTENVTNALATLNPTRYDRIAIGQLDSANLTLWRTQLNAQAEVLTGILQHAVCASNDTLTAATSLAQTALNAQRFQLCWHLSSETHPSEIAASMAGLRIQAEQSDPDAHFDGAILKGVAPQSQRTDWPIHATLVSALNNGVTPITTTPDGFATVVRSIVTHSLTGANPDYSTLDTGDAVVPDFVLTALKLYWLSQIVPNNPRVADDSSIDERRKPSGIITPSAWNAAVYGILKDFEAGRTGGVQIAPILINVDLNLPVSQFDPAAKRIMTALTVIPAPSNHQVGISVRQAA